MDHFPQPLQFEVLESAHKKLRVKLLAPFTYVDEIEGRPIKIEVKESFDTDFNSVPQGLWNLFPPTAYPEAGVVHDYIYRYNGMTRKEADGVHRRILEILGASWWLRWAAYGFLRTFAGKTWDKYRAAEAQHD